MPTKKRRLSERELADRLGALAEAADWRLDDDRGRVARAVLALARALHKGEARSRMVARMLTEGEKYLRSPEVDGWPYINTFATPGHAYDHALRVIEDQLDGGKLTSWIEAEINSALEKIRPGARMDMVAWVAFVRERGKKKGGLRGAGAALLAEALRSAGVSMAKIDRFEQAREKRLKRKPS